jgi:hypothetical protein
LAVGDKGGDEGVGSGESVQAVGAFGGWAQGDGGEELGGYVRQRSGEVDGGSEVIGEGGEDVGFEEIVECVVGGEGGEGRELVAQVVGEDLDADDPAGGSLFEGSECIGGLGVEAEVAGEGAELGVVEGGVVRVQGEQGVVEDEAANAQRRGGAGEDEVLLGGGEFGAEQAQALGGRVVAAAVEAETASVNHGIPRPLRGWGCGFHHLDFAHSRRSRAAKKQVIFKK